jgi:methionyl-tRNA formyltransferase
MVIEEGLDTGGVYARAEVPIGPDETADELRARLATLGTDLLLSNLSDGLPAPKPQEGEPTYAHKIDPAELRIDWDRPAIEIHRLVRIGGAWTTYQGHRLKVWRTALAEPGPDGIVVRAGEGAIHLVEVQPEGRRRMPARAWANGVHWRTGARVGT